MGKLSEFFKGFKEKVKNLSKTMKIAIIVSIILFVGAMIFLGINAKNNKYGVLFSNLDPNDAKVVTEKLKEKKVENKVTGNTIYVPKESVDELRLELAPDLTNGSKGYELLDQGQSLGMTDEEFKLKEQRALQGEIERTIKSFPEIENARVHLTPAESSVFVKDSKPGKASVFLKLKTGAKVSKEQVQSIVALVSGATSNTPKESIEVIDDKMNLLSKDLFDASAADGTVSSSSLEKQKGIETDFNSKLEKSILDMLEPVVGAGKVKAKVSTELDFDSKKKTQVVVDPNKVAVSEQTSKEGANQATGQTSGSPVDNNMTNSTANNTGNATSTKESQTVNYEVGKTETTVISAPGEIKRISASVIVDGNLDTKTQDNIKNAVSAAIGYKQDRGDQISIVGMSFDQTQKDLAKQQIDDMNKEAQAAKQKALYTKIGIAGGVALLVIAGIVVLARRKRKKNTNDDVLGLEEVNRIDVVVGDAVKPKDKVNFDPIDFDVENESSHIEKEIRKYANDKPEQVADIIKSWMADDERG